MSGVGFTYPFAKRVSSATKWVEGQRGILEPEEPTAIDAYKEILVRTIATLPPGYTGTMAAQAEIVDRAEDGTIIARMPVWVKDINGGTLSANTIYQARVGGTYTQDITVNGIVTPTTLGLYLVQAIGSGAASGWQLYEYRGGSANSSLLTMTSLETGFNALLLGNPLGIDAPGLSPMFDLVPRIWAKPVGGILQLYNVTPFSFFAKATSVVDDGFGNDIAYLESLFPSAVGYMATFRAKDPTRAFRANYSRYGVLPKVSVTWSPINYPFATPANQFPYLITAAEILQSTSGIGSGIGSGISGV